MLIQLRQQRAEIEILGYLGTPYAFPKTPPTRTRVVTRYQSNTGTSRQFPSLISDSWAMMPGTAKSMERMTSVGESGVAAWNATHREDCFGPV